ncbi:MAG: UPF0058 family protein [Methanomicrobia archaeon]|nr:UPF0058 family protein [Methanomicrobia archaeon]
MKKEELIHFHILLVQFKNYCEKNNFSGNLSKYKALDISPYQVHRSKEEHKQAIFVLATELVASLSANSNLTEIKKYQNGRKAKHAIA